MSIYPASHLPSRKVLLNNGKEYLWFSGTDYLGMGHNKDYLQYLHEGISIYGTHYGSSRNNSLRLNIYEEAETSLAKFAGAPAALTTSSGMWAGQLLMKQLPAIMSSDMRSENTGLQEVHYHYAPGVHPALWGERYEGSFSAWDEWAKNTVQEIQGSNPEAIHILCSDAVGSPFVKHFDFSIFNTLPFYRRIFLVVDDSHGLGISGQAGSGVFRTLSAIQQVRSIVTSSLNKALGIPGGVILGDEHVISTVRRSPWFAGASPVPPAYIFALIKLLETDTYASAYRTLLANIHYARAYLTGTGLFVYKDDYPVFCSLDSKLFDYLEANGILASRFSYPQPTDPPVIRLVVSAVHQKEDLDRLAEVCMQF